MGEILNFEDGFKIKKEKSTEEKDNQQVENDKFSEDDLKRYLIEKAQTHELKGGMAEFRGDRNALNKGKVINLRTVRSEAVAQELKEEGINIEGISSRQIFFQREVMAADQFKSGDDLPKLQQLRNFLKKHKDLPLGEEARFVSRLSDEDLLDYYKKTKTEDWEKKTSFYKALLLEILNRYNSK